MRQAAEPAFLEKAMNKKHHTALLLTLLLAIAPVAARTDTTPLTLDAAIRAAIDSDPWLSGSRETERALRDEAVAAGSLPDPRLNLQALNFPAWSFDINQEPMTQLAVGVSQQLPRGRSLTLARAQKESLAEAEPLRAPTGRPCSRPPYRACIWTPISPRPVVV